MCECDFDKEKSWIRIEINIKPWFVEMINFLWDERESIQNREDQSFDYPDYYGLPKKISSKLGSEDVDKIQDYRHELFDYKSFKNKKQFVKKFTERILNSNCIQIKYQEL